jgi:hypothetical protein
VVASFNEVYDLTWRALVERGAQGGWGRGGRERGLRPQKRGNRTLRNEVRLAESDVPEPHMDRQCRLEAYQEVDACGIWFPGCHEKTERLV